MYKTPIAAKKKRFVYKNRRESHDNNMLDAKVVEETTFFSSLLNFSMDHSPNTN